MSNVVKSSVWKTVVIVTKDAESWGGVANYFRLFFRKYGDDLIRIERFEVGSRSVDYYVRKHRKFRYTLTYIQNLVTLVKLLRENVNRAVVQVNPSLIPVPLIRDGIILLIGKAVGRKVIVFFRGWDEDVVEAMDRHLPFRRLFIATYSRADRVVVLAYRFRETLIRWGIPKRLISVSRTMFDGELVVAHRPNRNKLPHFLFLGRISESKGVLEIIKAGSILRSHRLRFRVTIAGYGRDTHIVERLKHLAKERGVMDLYDFKSYLDGKEKFDEYSRADVFLLPSYHPEGCPNSVLEAMASGLFVISTDVGALKEILKDGVHGKIVRSRDPQDLAAKMRWAIDNVEKVRELGKNNISYAFEHFEASVIINQMKHIYRQAICE